jgi:hypothetical protein
MVLHLAVAESLPTIVEILLILALFVGIVLEILRRNWYMVIVLAIVIVAIVVVFSLLF